MGARLLRCTRNDDLNWGCNLTGICCSGAAQFCGLGGATGYTIASAK
jgi:hypothetical protein